MKALEAKLCNGRRLGKILARVIGKPESLRFQLARDTVGVMLLNALSMGLGFIISVVLARFLGVGEFGLYAFAMSMLGLLVAPATFGFPQLLVREIAAYRVKREWHHIRGLLRFSQRVALGASLALAAMGSVLIWILPVNLSLNTRLAIVIALVALPLMALTQLKGAALRGFQRILEGQLVSTVVRPFSFLLLIGGAWLLGRALPMAHFALSLQAAAAGIALLAGIFLLKRHLRNEVPVASSSQSSQGAWLKSSLSLLMLQILNLIPQHAGIIMLGMMRGAEEVGLYKVAF